jgi:DNA-binding response OmpR family regulator
MKQHIYQIIKMSNTNNTVLIVEDEIGLRQLLKMKLESDGFRTIDAENGKVGLETALSRHPNVILLDIIMPVMDGISMLKELRKDDWGKDAAVIILSNLSEAEKISEGAEKDVYDYLVKSDWEPDAVVNLIKRILEKQK